MAVRISRLWWRSVRRRDRSLGDAAASDRARAAALADDPLCGHRAGSRRGGMAIDTGSKQTPGLAFRSRLSRRLRASQRLQADALKWPTCALESGAAARGVRAERTQNTFLDSS